MKIYGLKDLEYYRLRIGDVVSFCVKNKQGEFVDLKYEVVSDFLLNMRDSLYYDKTSNGEIFTILGLNPYEFCSKHYGYKVCNGAWPRYKYHDFEAATNVVKALYTMIDTMNVSESSIDKLKKISSQIKTIKEYNNSKLKRI